MAGWYYRQNDRQCGPISPSALKQLASSRELSPTDLVRKEGVTEWEAAGRVKGLFDANVAASMPPPLPSEREGRQPADDREEVSSLDQSHAGGSTKPPPLPDGPDQSPNGKRRRRGVPIIAIAWIAAITCCVGLVAYMLPGETRQIIGWGQNATNPMTASDGDTHIAESNDHLSPLGSGRDQPETNKTRDPVSPVTDVKVDHNDPLIGWFHPDNFAATKEGLLRRLVKMAETRVEGNDLAQIRVRNDFQGEVKPIIGMGVEWLLKVDSVTNEFVVLSNLSYELPSEKRSKNRPKAYVTVAKFRGWWGGAHLGVPEFENEDEQRPSLGMNRLRIGEDISVKQAFRLKEGGNVLVKGTIERVVSWEENTSVPKCTIQLTKARGFSEGASPEDKRKLLLATEGSRRFNANNLDETLKWLSNLREQLYEVSEGRNTGRLAKANREFQAAVSLAVGRKVTWIVRVVEVTRDRVVIDGTVGGSPRTVLCFNGYYRSQGRPYSEGNKNFGEFLRIGEQITQGKAASRATGDNLKIVAQVAEILPQIRNDELFTGAQPVLIVLKKVKAVE